MTDVAYEDVWRRESPHVLAALLRRHGDLGDCEDALQEAGEAAAVQWTRDGTPDNPRGWLIRVGSRRLIDAQRSLRAQSERERAATVRSTPGTDHLGPDYYPGSGHGQDSGPHHDADDTLLLLLLCCHPSLTRSSQVALTLHAVAGLTTEQIAAAYLVPTPTMGQRLTRARATLRAAGARFVRPTPDELPDRIAAVLDVCHLMFTEGHTRTGGSTLTDRTLADEAIRLTRQLHGALPDHDEVTGALALMLLTASRTAARTDRHGDLIPLADQDRSLWDRGAIAEGTAILERVLPRGHVGRFQLQAAIAAVHAEAPTADDTDWPQVTLLYGMLSDIAPSPAVTLNRAVAVAMTHGPERGLELVDTLLADDLAARRHHRTHAVRAHLLEIAGDSTAAADAYREAAKLTTSLPEQRYLNSRLARLVHAT